MRSSIIGAAALLLAGTPSAAEPAWTVDHATSRLGYAVAIGGTTATGRFDGWAAEIAFDQSRPEDGRVRVEIDMDTVSIDDARAQAVGDAAWLGAEAHPTAVFQSDRFNLTEDGALTVTGWLTLKGIQAPMTLTGTLVVEGMEAWADLSGTVTRLSHHVGVGQDTVAAEVTVQATLTARCDPAD